MTDPTNTLRTNPPLWVDDVAEEVVMGDQLIADRFKRRCPYRRFLRNVYIRRLYMLTAVPLWIVLMIPVMAIKGIVDELKDGIVDTIKAIQDPNSYD